MKFAKFIHIAVAAVSVLLIIGQIVLSSQRTQEKAAQLVTSYSNSVLGTEFRAASVRFTYPFGIEIKGMTVFDTNHDTLACISMAIAHFKPGQLLHKKLSISGIRLIHPDVRLHADSIGAIPNYAFLADLFKGDGNSSGLQLRVNSIVLRNASFIYDILDRPVIIDSFDRYHVGIEHLNTSISLKALGTDTVSVSVRKLRAHERSGFSVRSLRGSVSAGPHTISANGLTLRTDKSTISVSGFESESGLADIHRPLSCISFRTNASATVTGYDFKQFIPGATGMTDKIMITLNASCDSNLLNIQDLSLKFGHNELSVNSTATVLLDSALLCGDFIQSRADFIVHGSFSERLPKWIDRQFSEFAVQAPDECRNLGNGRFSIIANSGKDSSLLIAGIESEAGNTALEFIGKNGSYTISVDGSDIQVGKIAGTDYAGPCSFKLTASADSFSDSISGSASLNISSAILGGYCYKDIAASASVHGNEYNAIVNYSDTNGSASIHAGMFSNSTPTFWAELDANAVKLEKFSMGLLDSIEVSGQMNARFTGTDIDLMDAYLSIDSLRCTRPDGRCWYMNNMSAAMSGGNGIPRTATVSSDFIDASMAGNFMLSTLASSFSTLTSVITPTLADWLETNFKACRKKLTEDNSLAFNARISNLDFSSVIFNKSAYLPAAATFGLIMNESDESFQCSASIPNLEYEGSRITDFDMKASLDEGIFHSDMRGDILLESGQHFNLSNSADAGIDRKDSVDIGIHITDEQAGISIPLPIHVRLEGIRSHRLKSSIFIDRSKIALNSEIWELSLDSVSIHNATANISDLMVHSDDTQSSILAEGTVSADSADILHLRVNDIDLGRITDMTGLRKTGLQGIASGQLNLMGLLGKTAFEGSLDISDFEFMTSKQGNLEASFNWDLNGTKVDITGLATDSAYSARTVLEGFYRPDDSYIDIGVNATHTDLHFLNTWTGSVFSELSGRATGQIRIFGNKRSLDMEGCTVLENGILELESIGTKFIVKEDTLRFEPGKMLFDNIACYDEYGHDGIMDCHLYHTHFHDFRASMQANVTDMLVFKEPMTEKSNIFATVFAKGSVQLEYDRMNGLNIRADAKTTNGTRLGFKQADGQVSNNNFLSIVDRYSTRTDTASIFSTSALLSGPQEHSKFNLDLNVSCDYSAILDLSLGSLTGLMRGDGNIGIKYNRKDGIMLNGIYNLSYGMCSLSFEDLIRKDFSLNDGSYVRFNGALMDTELNLLTYHNVNSATIYDLDPSVSPDNTSRVRCLMDITGTAGDPKLSFDIDIPNGTTQEKDILASATATEEQRNIQFMYLLAIGRFYSYDVNAGTQNTGSPSAMESFVNSAINGQINRIMSSFLRNEQISLSSNLSAGSLLTNDATNLNNRELEGILEAHLLDNRLLVNGNFGYRESVINNTSNFIGDVEVRYKLFPRQGISLKGYNKSNDKYFSKTTLTTQGVGLVFERDF